MRKLSIEVVNSELTLIGYFEEGKWLEISKHNDGKIFWRVDNSSYTVSSLNRTKAEAMKEARKWIRDNWR